MERIYLDNASTTKIDSSVLEAMMPFLTDKFGNASSIHSFGKTAKVLLEDTRDLIASSLGVTSPEIFFTSGGTESNNFAIKGIATGFFGSKKIHIISSLAEHSAVLDTLKFLETKFDFDVTYLKPIPGGAVDPVDVENAVRESTFLIALMHSNNETGAITDIKKIADIAHSNEVVLHTDTVQSFGKLRLNIKELGSDTAIISAHKIYGPKGISALYIKKGTHVEKFLHGGMQERDMRGGTENIPAIAGFKRAVEMVNERLKEDVAHYLQLREILIQDLKYNFGEAVRFNSLADIEMTLPNILNFSFDKNRVEFDDEMLLILLDLKGIAISGGSACTSGTHKPSHVLLALGYDAKSALGAVRVSFGRENTLHDVEKFVAALKEIVKLK
ncbi:MAG: cysteine desulfurase [Ignavibacteria bacterium]|nr:cysteine desulfurase [Ignavibacteria bacterium]